MRVSTLGGGLFLAVLVACGAGSPLESGQAPTPLATDLSQFVVAVPVGWRAAVLAVAPGARVQEYEGAWPKADSTIGVVAAFSGPDADFLDEGAWLEDRITLAFRSDLASSPDDVDTSDPWNELLSLSSDDGWARLAVTSSTLARLKLAEEQNIPFDTATERLRPPLSEWPTALDAFMRRVVSADPLELLLAGQCEAAWLDGPSRARLELFQGRVRDRLTFIDVPHDARPLRLFSRTSQNAHLLALQLHAAREILRGLAYVPSA